MKWISRPAIEKEKGQEQESREKEEKKSVCLRRRLPRADAEKKGGNQVGEGGKGVVPGAVLYLSRG